MDKIKQHLICLLIIFITFHEVQAGKGICINLFNKSGNAAGVQTLSEVYHLRNNVVVLIFQKENSAACSLLNKQLDQIKPEFSKDPVSFIHIDIDTFPEAAKYYGVINLPTVLFYKFGELKQRVRVKPKEAFRQIILDLLGRSTNVSTILDNCILTRKYQYMSESPYLETANYIDGLGRDLLMISRNITPNKQNLAVLIEYDQLGRKSRTWLPGVLSGDEYNIEGIKNTIITSNLYNNDWNPFTKIIYEPSSLELVAKTYNPGEDWHNLDKAVTVQYLSNSRDNLCHYYYLTRASGSYVLKKSGNYPKNELFVTKMMDEDECVFFEFKNKLGQKIMSRQMNGNIPYDTYYIYDEYGNLCVVLPPKVVKKLNNDGSWVETDSNLKELCYLYKYDQRNRCIAKKLPGSDWILNIYDCMDRIVMTQDGNLRKEKKWFYNIYNDFDQPIINNIITDANNLSRDSIQSMYNIWFDNTYPLRNSGQNIGKPLQGDIFNISAKLQEIEYGDYDFVSLSNRLAFKPVYNIINIMDNRVKGLKTHERLYIIDDKINTTNANYIERAYYYDDKARVVQIVTKNKYDKISRESYKYDFIGNILARHELHETSSGKIDSLVVTFEYDHASRILSSTARLNGGSPSSVIYTYNELGQIKAKKYGSGINAINQTLKYNIRGWLEEQVNEVYETRLRYNKPLLSETKPSYSGNITEWEWYHKNRTGQSFQSNIYAFTYDSIKRLNETRQYIGGKLNNQHVEKGIRYDENGNILALQRTAFGNLIDNLTYTYSGNQLTSLRESVQTSSSGDIYLPGSTPVGTYTYDNNGNMITDSHKALKLVYNFLNLIREVKTSAGTVKATYEYLADGTKLGVRDNNNVNGFDYLGSLIYKKSNNGLVLESANFGDGIIRPGVSTSGQQEINYFLTDHLGSVRVIVDGSGGVKERNDYYSFGAKHSRSDYVTSNNRLKYSGMEEQTIGNLDYLDYGARMFDAEQGRWFGMDPLAEKYCGMSPYNYCMNNPINRVDPDGRADFWVNGQVIGNDGIDDKRILVIKTKESDFNGVQGAGLSKDAFDTTVDFIKTNNGNSKAFQQNGIAYTNSIAIESSTENRQLMVNIISKDNGRGGISDANNREYGGSIQNGVVVAASPGDVSNPKTNVSANIELPSGVSTFHSHPSGAIVESSSANTIGGIKNIYSFTQTTSSIDVSLAGANTHYVFGRSDGKVYVYTSAGIQAVIPLKHFVTPKPRKK